MAAVFRLNSMSVAVACLHNVSHREIHLFTVHPCDGVFQTFVLSAESGKIYCCLSFRADAVYLIYFVEAMMIEKMADVLIMDPDNCFKEKLNFKFGRCKLILDSHWQLMSRAQNWYEPPGGAVM